MDRKLTKLCSGSGGELGFRPGVGSNVGAHVNTLQSWGYLNVG
jgi:hypothetical protein